MKAKQRNKTKRIIGMQNVNIILPVPLQLQLIEIATLAKVDLSTVVSVVLAVGMVQAREMPR